MIVYIGFVLFQEDDSSFLPIIGFYSVWRVPDMCPEVSRISGQIFDRKSSEMSIYTVQKFRFISNVNYFDFPSKIRSGRIFHHTKSRVFWCPDMCPEIRDMCPEFRTFSRNGCFRCLRASPVCLNYFKVLLVILEHFGYSQTDQNLRFPFWSSDQKRLALTTSFKSSLT